MKSYFMAKNTSISLGVHFENFIAQQIQGGRYGSVSEVVRSALRLLEEREEKLSMLRNALQEGEMSGKADYDMASIVSELDDERY